MTREPAQEPRAPAVSQREFLRRLPGVLRDDPNFGRFLRSRVVLAFGGMASGFLAVYAVQRWHLSDGQAGSFTTSMLLGQALSNLLFGTLADRKGHKVVLEWSAGCAMLGVGLAIAAPSPIWFYAVFALVGASHAGLLLSGLMIALEFCTDARRPTYIGLNNTVWGIASGLAPVVGGWLADRASYLPLFVVALLCGGTGCALLRWSVREPRHEAGPVVLEKPGSA